MRAILSAATVRLRSALLFSAAVSLSLAIGLTTSAHAETEKRVALVIGNGDYRHAPKLANPVGDAHAVADSLRRLGFEVIEGYNLDAAAMRSSVANFSQALTDSRAALVYYAGHGVAADDDTRCAIAFQASHQPKPRFESAVIGFDSIVRVLLGVVERTRDEFVDDHSQGPGAIRDDLARGCVDPEYRREEASGGACIAST